MSMSQIERVVARAFAAEVGALFKVPGQAMTASVSFKHQGAAEQVLISWGITPGSGWPTRYNTAEIVWLVSRQPLQVSNDAVLPVQPNYQVNLSGVFPSSFPHPRIDCYIVIESPRGAEIAKFWDDVYSFAASVYQDLSATFS